MEQSELQRRHGHRRGWVHSHGATLVDLLRIVDAAWILAGLWITEQWVGVSWHDRHLTIGLLAVGFFTAAAGQWTLYRSWRVSPLRTELERAVSCWAVSMLLLAAVLYFFDPAPDVPRSLLPLWGFTVMVLMLGTRVVSRLVLRTLRRNGRNFRTAAIVGANETGHSIAGLMRRSTWMGMVVAGIYDDRAPQASRTHPEMKLDGGIDVLIQRVERGEIDVVYIVLPLRAELRIQQVVDRLRDSMVQILFVPDFSAFGLLHASWEVLGGMPMVSLMDTPHRGFEGASKRLFDIVMSSLILTLIAVPLLCIAVAIKTTSRGPVIFRQRRYGLDGKEFEIYKFRSMTTVEDGKNEFKQATKNDVRITPLGAFLRRTSLDELPQIINVLQGRMSLVGPRPHPVALNETQRKLIDNYMLRHKVRPGITGWAQVNGFRGETDTPEKMLNRIRCDLEYINYWSLKLDIKILWMTIFKVLDDPNAY
ncbi:undecaprenyl-phosphate glucose phosphotransferase [Piscinibacter terrae]|uniref:Undecaprenyl-phosphate glucose phosphotransferase n=1 Tax=Piscinibacter terrae TaxID=2496871 RepID=A0A3N7HJ86_9BURK|nr:undecaprenyl-phosphate glucose phosphotransferase [Albitalea terrae]RQP22108.1 undecaprenyl-phosphate glucose phosphotransferase [Albitalea terrae]